MADTFKFWILKFASHPMRGESLNVGLLLEKGGEFQVRIGRRLEKLKSISAAIKADEIEAEIREIPVFLSGLDSSAPADEVESVVSAQSFLCPSFQGSFDSKSSDLVEHYVADLMSRYINPEPALSVPVRKRPTRLREDIRKALRSEKILARPSEGLESHRVLYKHQLSEGVVADFVLQNGFMHVVESVDASLENISLQKCLYEIAMSTLTFEHARINFGNNSVKPRLIYNATSEHQKALHPSLYAAQNQGAEIVNWESETERNSFLVTLASLADSTDQDKAGPSLFNASPLPLRKLN